MLTTPTGRAVAGAIAMTVIAVVAGLVLLWPDASPDEGAAGPEVSGSQRAEVTAVTRGDCEPFAGPGCRLVQFDLLSGPRTGEASSLALSDDPFSPVIEAGDAIRVVRNLPPDVSPAAAEQLPIDDPSTQPFVFEDFDRGTTLLYLTLAFGLLVIALGRWQGARSLLGLGVSLLVVLAFIVPALLAGRSPLLVAVVGGMAVMLATMGLTHGIGLKSAAAILGTTAALVLTALLAVGAVRVAQITGLSSEQSRLLFTGATSNLSLQGLVIGGIIIGALGVLDDVTISQSSTVLALKRANPSLGFRRLFGEGLQVGRDHLGATVNTLVLAYVGASLPVLLIFGSDDTTLGEAANREFVAEEIVATLVGSTGLVAAVPLTTALAALLAGRLPVSSLPDQGAHAHIH